MKSARVAAALLFALVAVPARSHGWGLATHRAVEETAIDTLSEPLRGYFRAHREQISDWSVEPDTVLKERHGREETVRHFIDLDLYGSPPFAALPRSYAEAVRRYGEDVVKQRGTVPWTIDEKHERMVGELRRGDWRAALQTGAYGGHYIADATMPLHAVSDYDGQKSGSPGVHKAFEHEVVDRELDGIMRRVRARVGPARAADYDIDRVFAVLRESFAAVPQLLAADRDARRRAGFATPQYAALFGDETRDLATARLARAVALLGAFWVSAWDEAGGPRPPAAQ